MDVMFEECGVDPDQYAARDRDEYEAEPGTILTAE